MRQRSLIAAPYETVFSTDRVYRYLWRRIWDPSKAVCNFLMLNPSTADENVKDPTVAKCTRYAAMWGYGTLIVTNLFALRSTDPAGLLEVDDPVGCENDQYIQQTAEVSDLVVVAWGNHGLLENRSDYVVGNLLDGYKLTCLGKNKNGSPRHPLYVPYDYPREEFP